MISVFYRPEQSSTEADAYSPSAGKPKLVIQDWLSRPEIAKCIRLESFAPSDDAVLMSSHHPDYVTSIFAGKKTNGFGNTSLEIADSLRYTVGSMVAASKHALTMPSTTSFRVAVSPTSGFHHAGYAFGGAFCTFNGLMVAAIQVHAEGLAKRILIVDMDQHRGNGTDDIIQTLALSYIDHITARTNFKTASEALRCADLSLNEGMVRRTYDLVLYQAGADMHISDPSRGLLTTEQMKRRDELVFSGCAKYGIPLVWNLAGGYKRDAAGGIDPVLALHRNTMLQCIAQIES